MEYPDENEEFELLYQDELEILDEFPAEKDNPVSSCSNSNKPSELELVPNSPQLSQISFNNDESQLGGAVSRRLFGTPLVPTSRGASTPLNRKLQMPPIQEMVNLNDLEEMSCSTTKRPLTAFQKISTKRKRLERDLFGDIDDLFSDVSYQDPEAKKAKTEKEKDLEAIEKILVARRKQREQSKTIHKDHLARTQALHEFKTRNLSRTVPQWPFLLLRRSNDERIYVRFHSQAYESKAIDDVKVAPLIGSLLGDDKQKIWQEANNLVFKRLTAAETEQNNRVESTYKEQSYLWVEKYKPRKYIDLLSDEMTNRSLLFWLRMWDKVVFGKEFKALQANMTAGGQLNSFNKRTGKFEVNGGWKSRKFKQNFNTNVDELGRPMQKVALLCGPPGLGKTTLAHVIAKHAGYNVREINASDDRSPEAFQLVLENGTQMSALMNNDRRPNCIILDEIDGAPRQSIEYLVKYVTDACAIKKKTKLSSTKTKRNVLKRPIICICNDVYDPALRPLRQIAFVVNFPPIDTSRLADRLGQIAKQEHLKTDFGALIALAEKSSCDVRCCILTMQFFSAQNKVLTLRNVLNSKLGQKDRRQGLFDIWNSIFRIERPKKQLTQESDQEAEVTLTDMSLSTRAGHIHNVMHSAGDFERLVQGVYENFLQQKMPDPDFNGIAVAMQWFTFSDVLQKQIQHLQNYTVYPYLHFGFVKWHFLFASLAWPKIHFPTKGFEFYQRHTAQKNIFLALRKGITSGAVGIGQGCKLLLDTVAPLKRILSPQLRSVALQLLSNKEQYDLKHTIQIMVDLGLTYIQLKTAEGSHICRMEPDLDALFQFPGFPGITLTYCSRQLLAREVELESIQRSIPKHSQDTMTSTISTIPPTNVPNHLQRLIPKKLEKKPKTKGKEEVISKDFFGRVQRKTNTESLEQESTSNPIVKSSIWYRYKEGFNNAVRKDISMQELL